MADTIEKFARDYPVGMTLFREGDSGEHMYVIQSGKIRITRSIASETQVLADLPAGEFFGEMSILNHRPRSATATVLEAARLLVIDGDTFEAMIRGRTEIAVRLVKTMAARLERANQQIELLLLKDETHRVVKALRQLAEDADGPSEAGLFINISTHELATRTSMTRQELLEILQRLALSGLVIFAEEAGINRPGFILPEVGRLLEFLEFLDLKERGDV